MPNFALGRYRNLVFNARHGPMGCSAALIAADLFAGRTPEIPLGGMTVR